MSRFSQLLEAPGGRLTATVFPIFGGGQGCQKSEDLFAALSQGRAKTISFLILPGFHLVLPPLTGFAGWAPAPWHSRVGDEAHSCLLFGRMVHM